MIPLRSLVDKYWGIVLNVILGLAFAAFTLLALTWVPYYPPQWDKLVVGLVFVVTVANPAWGVVACLAVLALPVAHVSLEIGEGYILAALLLVLSSGNRLVTTFLLMAMGAIAIWAPAAAPALLIVPILSGLILGKQSGTAFTICVATFTQILGMITGTRAIGVLFAGGATPLYPMPAPVNNLSNLQWLVQSLNQLDMGAVYSQLFIPYVHDPLLVGQIGVWAVAAYVAGALSDIWRPGWRWIWRPILASAGVLLVGHWLLLWSLGENTVTLPLLVLATLLSTLIAFGIYPVLSTANRQVGLE
ncbi:MAG: hypothetical protein HY326_13215 [Chloroflexi bacterium]|nr:hypothetical protein [Chloroflexota bacterium]